VRQEAGNCTCKRTQYAFENAAGAYVQATQKRNGDPEAQRCAQTRRGDKRARNGSEKPYVVQIYSSKRQA